MAKKRNVKADRMNMTMAYFLVGMGVGILVTNPVVNPHPVRWALVLIGLGVASYYLTRMGSK